MAKGSTMARRLAPALGAAALALALAGCATATAPGAGETTPADPAGQTKPQGSAPLEADAAWLHGGSMIAVITYGSSSCRPGVEDAVLDDGVLVVTLVQPGDGPCTDDLVPQALAVAAPGGVEPADGLDVQVLLGDDVADVALAPYTGGAVEEYTPSAGWAGDDKIAILTWGSSSCAPAIESTTVVSPTEVAVTFAAARADQVCTMDMAPRVVVAVTEGEVSRDATVTLGGLSGGAPGDREVGAPIPIG